MLYDKSGDLHYLIMYKYFLKISSVLNIALIYGWYHDHKILQNIIVKQDNNSIDLIDFTVTHLLTCISTLNEEELIDNYKDPKQLDKLLASQIPE